MIKYLTTAVLAIAFVAAPASADWNPGDPYKMHFPQLPDLSPEGLDVLAGVATEPSPAIKYIADDFRCTATGPITDIHIWGSWLFDRTPMPEDAQGSFILGLYDDIPAVVGGPHSRPGELLWHQVFRPGEYQSRVYANASEQFFDPNTNRIIGTDNRVWQYNFLIDESAALVQERDKIYWLAVANVDPDNDQFINSRDLSNAQNGAWRFGWKTSRDHWNDDAVFLDWDLPIGIPVDLVHPPQGAPAPGLPWRELIDPRTGISLDMAFVITPEPATLALLTLGALAVLRRR